MCHWKTLNLTFTYGELSTNLFQPFLRIISFFTTSFYEGLKRMCDGTTWYYLTYYIKYLVFLRNMSFSNSCSLLVVLEHFPLISSSFNPFGNSKSSLRGVKVQWNELASAKRHDCLAFMMTADKKRLSPAATRIMCVLITAASGCSYCFPFLATWRMSRQKSVTCITPTRESREFEERQLGLHWKGSLKIQEECSLKSTQTQSNHWNWKMTS